MKRTRAESLVLVNWRGVFYERYRLDEAVTAIEGANGAGKTTVMIAAYVVLLPDLTKLRFTNLGETAATGGDRGIWGRLGEENSPSYCAIDFRLADGKRLLAGVQLERKSEPTLELTPFVAAGLDDDVALQDVLLDRGEQDTVPDMQRLRELVARGGGRLEVFSRNADYFAALFDRGVTPLRLTNDEERTKLNEMLRTSMVGGISRALTGGLREFLLRAESGLADTLKRMRANLDACRRTRTEVEAARRMEGELSGVLEAGERMFCAAVHGTRMRADEQQKRFDGAVRALADAERAAGAVEADLAQRASRHGAVAAELQTTIERRDEAATLHERVRRAHDIVVRMDRRRVERTELAAAAERAAAAAQRCRADLDGARQRSSDARQAHVAAARGLADFQAGLDELHRRAAAFHHAELRLADARRHLPGDDVAVDTVSNLRSAVEPRLAAADGRLVELDRAVSSAARRRADFDRALTALGSLLPAPVEPVGAYEAARAVLRDERDRQARVDELETLPARIGEARTRAERQQKARAAAAALGDRAPTTAADLRARHGTAEDELEAARAEATATRAAIVAAEAEQQRNQAAVAELAALSSRWHELRAAGAELATAWERALPDLAALSTLRDELTAQCDDVAVRIRTLQDDVGERRARADGLEHGGGSFSPALLDVRDHLAGELLAGHFDDVTVDEAARRQAELGPLIDAVVVDDAARAAEGWPTSPSGPTRSGSSTGRRTCPSAPTTTGA